MADFQNCLISRIFGVFSGGFLHRTTVVWLKNRSSNVFLNFNFWPKLTILPRHDDRFSKSSHFSNILSFLTRFFAQSNSNVIKEIVFRMSFLISIFDVKWPFCQGYCLCKMADFQNRLISRIFGVFSSGFLHRTTVMWLKNRSSHVFLNFNLWPKLTILRRQKPLHDGRFSKSSDFSNIWCFLRRLFAQNNSNVIKEIVFRMFFFISIFDVKWPFCQGYSLCTMADVQNRLISRIFGVFSSGFLHRTALMRLKNRSSHVFLNFNFWLKLTILPRHDDWFSKSSHFSNIWCFLTRFFAQSNSNVIKEIVFRKIFWILIFDPNWPFCEGYSLCTMADFHNFLISLIFGVFSSGFFHRTTLMWLRNRFSHVFLNFWPKLTILSRL